MLQKEREAYEVIVENGKLVYKQREDLVNTDEESKWIFVLSTSRALYVGRVCILHKIYILITYYFRTTQSVTIFIKPLLFELNIYLGSPCFLCYKNLLPGNIVIPSV